MKTLIVEGQKHIADVLAVHLKSELGFDCDYAPSAQEALSILSKNADYGLIIVRNIIGETQSVDGEEAARILCNYIYDKELKISVLVLGEFDHIGISCTSLPDHFKLNTLTTTLIKFLDIGHAEISDYKLPDYIPVPITHFYLMNRSPCDIFMKLKKGEEENFVKRINGAEDFDKTAVQRYNTKFGLQEFYVRKDDRQAFFDSLLEQSSVKLSNSKFDLDRKIEMVEDSYAIAGDLLRKSGVDEKSVKMTKATVESIKQTIQGTPKIGELLKKMMARPSSFAFKHSFLISVFFPKVLKTMEWCPQNMLAQTFEKMVFISFFHDILLDDEKLVRIHDQAALKAANLSDEEKDLVLNHASRAAELLQSFSHAPPGADAIIRQHHGMMNGVGFPTAYGVNISPISILFIVVESFVHELLNVHETKKTIPQIIADLYVRFPMNSYKKMIDSLKESLSHDL